MLSSEDRWFTLCRKKEINQDELNLGKLNRDELNWDELWFSQLWQPATLQNIVSTLLLHKHDQLIETECPAVSY